MTHPTTSQIPSFQAQCLAEAIRLKESGWGPLDDTAEVRRVIAQGGSVEERLLYRAQLLAEREGLGPAYQRLRQWVRWILVVWCGLALVTGASMVWGVLGASIPVNVMTAVVSVVGLNVLMLLLWLGSFLLRQDAVQEGSLLGRLSLKLLARLARSEANTLVLGAGVNVMVRQQLGRWVSGCVSHLFWGCFSIAALLTLLWALSAKRYEFGWETTLLSAQSFVWLVQGLGVIPSWLGFAVPSAELIRVSDGLTPLATADQRLWSSWLLGCLVCYGLLPRLVAGLYSAMVVRYRVRALHIDRQLTGWLEQQERLLPGYVWGGVDADAPDDTVVVTAQPTVCIAPQATDNVCIVGIEYPDDLPWPPVVLPADWTDAGVVDTRIQREQLLARLQVHRPDYIVLVCDARQTPDRGVVAWLSELSHYGEHCAVVVYRASESAAPVERISAWQDRLSAAGFKPEQVHPNLRSFSLSA